MLSKVLTGTDTERAQPVVFSFASVSAIGTALKEGAPMTTNAGRCGRRFSAWKANCQPQNATHLRPAGSRASRKRALKSLRLSSA